MVMPFTRQTGKTLAVTPHEAQLTDAYADQAEDNNEDGIYEDLTIDVEVTATEAGTYTLAADLVASEQTVAHAVEYIVLESGVQTVTLRFDGADIFRSQLNGPYTVTNVSLVNLGVGGLPAEMAEEVWTTAAYDWRDFGFHPNFTATSVAGTAPLTVTFTAVRSSRYRPVCLYLPTYDLCR